MSRSTPQSAPAPVQPAALLTLALALAGLAAGAVLLAARPPDPPIPASVPPAHLARLQEERDCTTLQATLDFYGLEQWWNSPDRIENARPAGAEVVRLERAYAKAATEQLAAAGCDP